MGKLVLKPGLAAQLASFLRIPVGGAGAKEVAKIAKEIAPFDPDHTSPEPHYRDNIHVVENRVEARNSYSGFIEFGTSDTPIFAVLRRAATKAGLKRGKVQNL